jgi:hypothetical protein
MHNPLEQLQQFRRQVYQSFSRRADALMDLVDGLACSDHVESPVAVSQNPGFRRRFPSIYDALHFATPERSKLEKLCYESVPEDAQTLAGYEVYAVDMTPQPRPAAQTLADRILLCGRDDEAAVPGHKHSLLVRLIQSGRSWVAPLCSERVTSDRTGNDVAAGQAKALDQRSPRPKALVADSGYANQQFLGAFVALSTVCALVRLRSNQVLYEAGSVRQRRGRKCVHGNAFRLSGPARPPDRQETLPLPQGSVLLKAWLDLHLRKLPLLPGMVIQVQILRPDGQLRHRRPWWLFWSGPPDVCLADLFRMYAWRFAIEHAFRFFKQHLGLNAANLVLPAATENWAWCCLLAYWQLLLASAVVTGYLPPWQSQPKALSPWCYTPRQVQRALPLFSARIGTPAAPPKPAGKGRGRAVGFKPKPRKRFAIVVKGQKTHKAAAPPAA